MQCRLLACGLALACGLEKNSLLQCRLLAHGLALACKLGDNYTAALPLAGSWTGEKYTAAVLLASLPIGNGLPPSRCNFEISTNNVSNYTALKPGTDLQLPTTQPRFKNRRQTYWNRGRTN